VLLLAAASKDFWDTKHQRRVLWGWSMTSGKSLPRELTYDPRFQLIVQTPVDELRELRSDAPVASIDETSVKPGQELPLYNKAAGNSSDAMVTFQLPKGLNLTRGMFGVATMGIVPADGTVGNLSACSNGIFVGVNYTAPTATQRAAGKYNVTTTVNGKTGQLWLLTNESEVTVEIFTDISVVEVYWQGGRSVTTGSATINEPHTHTPLPLPPDAVRGGMQICNNASAVIEVQAKVWTMESIWATKAEVLATPRRAPTGKQPIGN
jgi:sucrose-6-phosphate hydrolase SacC (GH32 family)